MSRVTNTTATAAAVEGQETTPSFVTDNFKRAIVALDQARMLFALAADEEGDPRVGDALQLYEALTPPWKKHRPHVAAVIKRHDDRKGKST